MASGLYNTRRKPFKIWEATYEETKEGGEPGAILADKTTLKIVAGDGTLIVPTVIQPAGKPRWMFLIHDRSWQKFKQDDKVW